jgi:hypothetical protein
MFSIHATKPRPAKVEPVVNSSLGASIVLVTPKSSAERNYVPHSPQNLKVLGLSV